MIICPNKSSKQWKELSEAMGEPWAMLAFFRNNNEIPTIDRARELVTDRSVLESLDKISTTSVEEIEKTLIESGIVYSEPAVDETGSNVYSLKEDDIQYQRDTLATITDNFGFVIKHLGENNIKVLPDAVDLYNSMSNAKLLERMSLTELSRRFLQKMGINTIEDADYVLERYGSNGIADFARRMVIIQKGMSDEALPEEALHFFLDMMPQNDEALVEALDKIRLTKTYGETLEKYKNNPNYQIDGKPNFPKIRKEALAKELAHQLKKKEVKPLWKKLLDAIMKWINSTPIANDPFEKLQDLFLSGNIDNLNRNLKSNELYNQLAGDKKAFYEAQPMNEQQKETFQKLLQITSKINFDPVAHKYTYETGPSLISVTTALGSDFTSELDRPELVAELINALKDEYPNVYNETLSTEQNKKAILEELFLDIKLNVLTPEVLNDLLGPKLAQIVLKNYENQRKTLFGTALHSIAESLILGKSIDFENISEDIKYFMDAKTLQKLIYEGTPDSKALIDVIKELRDQGAVLMTEFEIGNSKLGGIIDIIAIKKDGSVEILDFKTKFLREYKGKEKTIEGEFNKQVSLLSSGGIKSEPNTIPELIGRRRSLISKYTQQQSLYKRLLMEAGIRVGKISIVGIPYTLNAQGKIDNSKIVVIDNLRYDSKVGDIFFDEVDPTLDAIARPKLEQKDPRTKELDDLSNEKLKEMFGRMMGRVTQIYESFIRRKDSKIAQLLLETDDTTDSVSEQLNRLEKTLENFESFKSEIQKQKNFIEMVDSSGPIIAKVAKAFDQLSKTTSADPKARAEKLNELMKMKDFLIGYQKMFDEMLEYMSNTIGTVEDQQNHLLVNRIKQMNSEITNIKNAYVKIITPDIVENLGEVFSPELIDNLKREFDELIASAKLRKDTKRVQELEKMKADLPNTKTISDFLKGKKGDVGFFFSYLTATISNPDLVVAGVAKRLKSALDRVRLINKNFRDAVATQLEKRNKVYGTGLDLKQRNESLVYDVKSIDENTGEEFMKRVIKTEFDVERLQYDYSVLKLKMRAEEAKPNNEDEIKKAKDAVRAFEKKYLMGYFTEEYNNLTAILDTEVTYNGKKRSIRDIRGEILDRIKSVHARYHPDEIESGAMDMSDIQELANHWSEYMYLSQKLDKNGNPKTGDELKIAEILEQYKEETNGIHDNIELRGAFDKADEKMKILYGEDSEQYKEWRTRNTRTVLTEEYFKRRKEIQDEMSSIIPNDDAVSIEEMYNELRLLTRAYRDEDGTIQGNLIPDEVASKVKKIEEKIRELRKDDTLYNFRGLTVEENDTLVKEYEKKRLGQPQDQRLINELLELGKERIAQKESKVQNKIIMQFGSSITADQLAEKVNRYNELKKELSEMSRMEVSPYYEIEKEERLKQFALSKGLSDVKDVKRSFELLQEFQQTPWFKANHNFRHVTRYDSEGGLAVESYSYEPTYMWKRSVADAKYVEEKPARHFYRRVVKESFVNSKGETVQLINKNNRDILNRRMPRTNESYKKEFGIDHPYLNKDYVQLRQKYSSNTASEKERVDYENLLYLEKTMLEAQEKIELSQRIGLAVPFMEKTKTERVIETKGQSVMDSAKSFYESVTRAFKRTEDDIDEGIPNEKRETAKLATMDNEQVRFIPVRYKSRGQLENASYDVWGGVLNYVGSINRKVELEKELAFINGLEEVLGDTVNQPKAETNNLVFNRIFKKYNLPELEEKLNLGSNRRLDVIKSFVNSVMYNEEYFAGIDVLGINTQKAVSSMMGLSSFAVLAAAPLNWMTNMMSGNVQNIIEAAGGNVYSMSEYGKAKGVVYGNGAFGGKYGSVIKDMMTDFSKLGNLSYWGQMMELFDPIQGEFENEYGQKTKFSAARNILKLGPFAGKVWGEWEIQMSGFIAFMIGHKVYNDKIVDRDTFITMKLGNVSSMTPQEIQNKKLEALAEFDKLENNLLDVFEMKDGKLVVKTQFEKTFDINSQQFSDVVAKLHSMQKRINGSYAGFDRSYVEKTSFGRLVFFFRKYVIPLALNRLSTMRVNYEGMQVEEGFYVTFIKAIVSDLKQYQFNIVKNWNNYSDFEKRAIKKTLTEVGALITMIAILSLLLGWDEDDKDRFKKLKEKGWGHQALVYVLLKTKSETEQFLPVPGFGLNEIKRLYSNPSIAFNEVTRYIEISSLLVDHAQDIVGLNSDDLYYKSSVDNSGLKDKGDSKLAAKLFGAIGYTGRTFNPLDAIKSFEYSQRLK